MHRLAQFARPHLNLCRLLLFVCFLFLPAFAHATTVYLTSGSQWTVPSDWNNSNNTVEAYGGGGGGGGGYADGNYTMAGDGGGGGGYSRISNVTLTPGSSVPYSAGSGGGGGEGEGGGNPPDNGLGGGGSGGNTFFNGSSCGGSTLCAGGGQGGSYVDGSDQWCSAGAGGSGNVSNGGSGGTGGCYYEGGGGGGGGGAGGPSGGGAQGGAGPGGYGGVAGTGGGGGGGYAGAGGSGEALDSAQNVPGAPGCSGGAVGNPAPGGGSYGGGGGGGAASDNCVNTGPGGNGAPGLIIITYTPSTPPTCTVSLSPNPSAYAYSGTPATLTWSSSNADEVYINNIGWVGTSGSTQVASQQTTDYSCYGYSASYGDGSWYSASLTVNAPPSPSTSISASPASIRVGQSSAISATYAAGSGDALTADNIDSPVGTGLGPNTNPGPKSITFTPSSAGTYTFYARATTDYYSSWGTYNQTTVTVTNPPPTATLSASPSSITRGGSSTLSWSSTNATSCTGSNFSTGGATSGHVSVSPAQTTTYTGSCTGAGGTSNFNAAVSVTCTESWSCSGQTIVQTNPDCSTTNLPACISPAFCQNGSNQCLYPTISISRQLQLIPNLVSSGETAQVYWNVSNAKSCTVTGTNGNSWSAASSPANGDTSKPITAATTYTLSCTAYGANPSVTESETVNVAPVYKEL